MDIILFFVIVVGFFCLLNYKKTYKCEDRCVPPQTIKTGPNRHIIIGRDGNDNLTISHTGYIDEREAFIDIIGILNAPR